VTLVAALGLTFSLSSPSVGFAADPGAGDGDTGFTLRDFLGRTWRNECVRFPLSGAALEDARAIKHLVGPDEVGVSYQIIPREGKSGPQPAFLADLGSFESRVYRFARRPGRPSTDLEIEQTDDSFRVVNSAIGISVSRVLKEGSGPIEKVQLPSGKWIRGSQLRSGRKSIKYHAEIAARGPVFVEIVCRAEFDTSQTWEIRFRLQAHEPVVLVEETSSVGDKSMLTLALSPGFAPDRLFHRLGADNEAGRTGTNVVRQIEPAGRGSLFALEPWLRWWGDPNKGNWFAVDHEGAQDLLAIGTRSGTLGRSRGAIPGPGSGDRDTGGRRVATASPVAWPQTPVDHPGARSGRGHHCRR
jgi:hypothetical protein